MLVFVKRHINHIANLLMGTYGVLSIISVNQKVPHIVFQQETEPRLNKAMLTVVNTFLPQWSYNGF